MLSFHNMTKFEKWCDQLVANMGQRKKIWVPNRNWTYHVAGNFCDFCSFSSNLQTYSRIKITTNFFFPAKIYSRVNFLSLILAAQKYSTEKLCLFNHKLSLSFRNNERLVYCLKKYIHFFCTYSIKTNILSMLGSGYFLKIAKINSQQEKPICPNRKNYFPQNTKNHQSAKINSRKNFVPHVHRLDAIPIELWWTHGQPGHIRGSSTVKPLLSGHLQDLLKCLLNRGCLLKRGCKNCAMFVKDQHSMVTLYCDKVACC